VPIRSCVLIGRRHSARMRIWRRRPAHVRPRKVCLRAPNATAAHLSASPRLPRAQRTQSAAREAARPPGQRTGRGQVQRLVGRLDCQHAASTCVRRATHLKKRCVGVAGAQHDAALSFPRETPRSFRPHRPLAQQSRLPGGHGTTAQLAGQRRLGTMSCATTLQIALACDGAAVATGARLASTHHRSEANRSCDTYRSVQRISR
jgi:hypothetical protein